MMRTRALVLWGICSWAAFACGGNDDATDGSGQKSKGGASSDESGSGGSGGPDGASSGGRSGHGDAGGGSVAGGTSVDGDGSSGGNGGEAGLGGSTGLGGDVGFGGAGAGVCNGLAAQHFDDSTVGCQGKLEYSERDICGSGWTVCTASQWLAALDGGASAPTHHYWVEEALLYGGSSDACMVSDNPDFGGGDGDGGGLAMSECQREVEGGDGDGGGVLGPFSPMRVCAENFEDPLGNQCNWTGCGWEDTQTDDYFGGCEGNTTAGVLCCAIALR
jgi:hypothetical protein